MERVILHCDLNNFFASVESLFNPEFKQHPMAVGGDEAKRHGIVLAKNEQAKKFGVMTGETLWAAKQKCPGLLIAPPHHDLYLHYSKLAQEIYARFTDQVEPFGIDECWLDVTGSTHLFGDGLSIANQLRHTIKEELGLTISVGVSFNKVFAKLGSDLKKPDAVTCIASEDFKQILWPLSVSTLLGAGRATSKKLSLYGIHTIGQLANTSPQLLKQLLGENGLQLWVNANGRDTSPIHSIYALDAVKSIGNSTTCPKDLLTYEEVWHTFLKLAENVSSRLRHQDLLTSSVQIWVKDAHFNVKQFQEPLPFPSRTSIDLAKVSMKLFKAHCHFTVPIRALGIRAISLTDPNSPEQMDLFADSKEHVRREAVETTMDELRNKFGKDIIKKGSLMLHQ